MKNTATAIWEDGGWWVRMEWAAEDGTRESFDYHPLYLSPSKNAKKEDIYEMLREAILYEGTAITELQEIEFDFCIERD